MNNFSWDKLKIISDLKFVRFMNLWIFIVPLLAKIFENVNGSYTFIIFQEPIVIQLTLPFSWIVFYFSAISFFIGNVLIMSRCPLIVKENNSYDDYRKSGKMLKQLAPYSIDINHDWKSLADNVAKKTAMQNSKDDENSLEKNLKLSAEMNDPRKYFWPIYDEAKISRTNWRLATLMFYTLGFTLLLYVLFENFFTVIEIIYK